MKKRTTRRRYDQIELFPTEDVAAVSHNPTTSKAQNHSKVRLKVRPGARRLVVPGYDNATLT